MSSSRGAVLLMSHSTDADRLASCRADWQSIQQRRKEPIEIASGEMQSAQTRGRGGLHVDVLVPDHEAPLRDDRPGAHEIEKHARRRLAPIRIARVGGDSSFGKVGAVTNVIEMRTPGAQLPFQVI